MSSQTLERWKREKILAAMAEMFESIRRNLNLSPDVVIQALILFLALSMGLVLLNIPRQALLTRFRRKNQSSVDARRHFIKGAQFLARARSAGKKSTLSVTLARSAREESDRAIALDSRDAAAYILKALALDFQGHHVSALRSLDTALSPPLSKSLASKERGDALFKRAEIQLAVNKKRKVESAVADLVEAVKLNPENGNAFCLLGECYEKKHMKSEAKSAYESALRAGVGASSTGALEALSRLAQSSTSLQPQTEATEQSS